MSKRAVFHSGGTYAAGNTQGETPAVSKDQLAPTKKNSCHACLHITKNVTVCKLCKQSVCETCERDHRIYCTRRYKGELS